MLRKLSAFALVAFTFISIAHAQVGRRKALIISNGAYTHLNSLLESASKDAAGVRSALEANGFEATDIKTWVDLNETQFLEKLSDFASTLHEDDLAVFYFSGHGFSINNRDYLAPTAFDFGKDLDESAQSAISVPTVVSYLGASKRRVLIFDSCRDEPQILRERSKNVSTRDQIGTMVAPESNGSLIAFATKQGYTSSAKSESGMSLYTSVLVADLKQHPPELKAALDKVVIDVDKLSHGTQTPALYSELSGFIPLTTDVIRQGTAIISPDKENVARFLQKTCTRGVTWQSVAFELPGEVYKSASQIGADADSLRMSLPALSDGIKPVMEIENSVKELTQNRIIFPQGENTPAAPPSDEFRSSLCAFRDKLSGARSLLETMYGVPSQCSAAITCPNEHQVFTQTTIQQSLRLNVSKYTVRRGLIHTFNEWALWMDLPVELQGQIASVEYNFPEGYLRNSTVTAEDGNPAIGLAIWAANTCTADNALSRANVHLKDGKTLIAPFDLCKVMPKENVPQ